MSNTAPCLPARYMGVIINDTYLEKNLIGLDRCGWRGLANARKGNGG